MEVPPPDPKKLLQSWMEWERGEVTPGRVMANLKTGGLPMLLEGLVAAAGAEDGAAGPGADGEGNEAERSPATSNEARLAP